MSEDIVIIGAGHAAGQLLVTLKQKEFSGKITLIGEEAYYPYKRPPLSKTYLADELTLDRLLVKPPSFYEDIQTSVLLNTKVSFVDRSNKVVQTKDGKHITYDKLIFATGARPRKINLPGSNLKGIFYLRNIDHVKRIKSKLSPDSVITIVGAGYIGLEVAAVAAKIGAEVTVVEAKDRVMNRVVSKEISNFYENEHKKHGVKIILSSKIDAFLGDKNVTSVKLSDGKTIKTNIVIIGIGAIPNTEIAAQTDLGIDDGIIVNSRCLTEDPHIYAIGDCTSHPNVLLGKSIRLESVHNAVEQAKIAAENICGIDNHYKSIPWFWSDQYDIKLQIAGLSYKYDETVIRGKIESRSFSCIYIKDQFIIAIDSINNPGDFIQGKLLIENKTKIDRETLSNPKIMLKDM